ncbi:hypothetical protein ABZP36_032575 [Zizania latifolia]
MQNKTHDIFEASSPPLSCSAMRAIPFVSKALQSFSSLAILCHHLQWYSFLSPPFLLLASALESLSTASDDQQHHICALARQQQQHHPPWPAAPGVLLMEPYLTNNWEGQVLFPTTPAAGTEADGSSSGNIYSTTTSHGSNNSTNDETPFARSSPWGGIHRHHHRNNALQQQAAASSPRSSCITSTTTLGSNLLDFSNDSSPRECISTASGAAFKKARTQEPSPAQSTVKVIKEKLGDRITALHQLVSPFGKTDTASVLLEAIGYIRFLHGQIEALSSPYLGNGGGSSSSSRQQQQEDATRGQLGCMAADRHRRRSMGMVQGERNSIFPEDPGQQLLHDNAMKKRGQPDQDESCEETKKRDLSSRGLCLVPVSCTPVDVGVDTGPAEYWAAAPAAFGIGSAAKSPPARPVGQCAADEKRPVDRPGLQEREPNGEIDHIFICDRISTL